MGATKTLGAFIYKQGPTSMAMRNDTVMARTGARPSFWATILPLSVMRCLSRQKVAGPRDSARVFTKSS